MKIDFKPATNMKTNLTEKIIRGIVQKTLCDGLFPKEERRQENMEGSVINQICASMDSFFDTEKKIGDYIVRNPKKVTNGRPP